MNNRSIFKITAVCALSLAAVLSVRASNPANDNASNSPYNGSSWNNGDNGGVGFGAWSFSNGVTTNGFAGEYDGGTGDGTPAWGLFAADNNDSGGNGNSFATATRPFTGGGLVTGESISLNLGSTSGVYDGSGGGGPGVIGLNLLSGATTVFTFDFTGGNTFWQVNDGATNFNTTIPFSANSPINFTFTHQGGDNYDLLITEGATTYTATGFTANDDISDIDGVKLFDSGQGSGQNIGFNDLSITVPEPSTWAAGTLVAALLTFTAARRRRVGQS